MKKFNGFEAHLLEQGLKIYCTQIIDDIIEAEKNGQRPIMTVDYIRSIGKGTLDKLKSLTYKTK
jgi:hypothetical protein